MENIENELKEIKKNVNELVSLINMLLPAAPMSLKFLSERTGLTKEGVKYQLKKKFVEEKDYFKNSEGIIMVTRRAGIQILMNSKGL